MKNGSRRRWFGPEHVNFGFAVIRSSSYLCLYGRALDGPFVRVLSRGDCSRFFKGVPEF